ncbi:MAG: hypothetical protein RBU30_00950 [Polyangia bacterium]|nr:hypothetical protein [Polyangia bacterium]
MRPRSLALLVLVALSATAGCSRPLGAVFRQGRDGGPLPDGAPPPDGAVPDGAVPDGGRPDGAIPDGAVNEPPLAICDEDRDTAPGRTITLYGDGEDDWGIVSWSWDVVSLPQGSSPSLGTPLARNTTFETDAIGDYTVQLTVRDLGGLGDTCSTLVRSRVNPPTAICPPDMTVPTRTPVTLHGDAQDDGYIVSWRWQVVSHNADTDPVLGTPNAQNTSFQALRVAQYQMRLTVTDEHGLTDICQFLITTTPTPPTVTCPADIYTVPLVPVQWTGSAIDDGAIASVRWDMISQPAGSSAPGPSPATQLSTGFTPDLVGTYLMRLTVTDDQGNPASCQFSVNATTGEGLRVEMYWNPPESPYDNSDVDLHLLHPSASAWAGGSADLDCYYANCQVPQILDWDVLNYTPDNPHLDLDDTMGYGPENINVGSPVIGHSYAVGVHYYSNNGSSATAQVYVKIYCGITNMNPVYEVGPFAIQGSSDPSNNDFWKVASVTWNGFTCAVTPIGQVVRHWQAEQAR